MAKDILSLKNKFFTKSSMRIILFNTFTMLMFYAAFNVFFFLVLDNQLERQVDIALHHEMDHFIQLVALVDDSLILNHGEELNETDLNELTEHPYFLQILDKTGKIIYQSKNMRYLSGIPIHFPLYKDNLTFVNYQVDSRNLRTGYQPIYKNNQLVGFIQLSTFKSAGKEVLTNILFFDLISFPLVLLLILGIAYMNAQQYLAPIRKVIELARRISASDLSQRLTYKADDDDEMGQLRDTLNHLFERLDRQIRQIAQFTDNAAHQLMSPLTIIKTELEFVTRENHTHSDCAETFQILVEQTDRMIHIVNTLLILAKDDSGRLVENSIINLQKILLQLKETYPERVHLPEIKNTIFLRGNNDYFLMALQNLIDNGLKYSDDNTPVIVEAEQDNGWVHIRVKDQGIGIPDKEKERIFERFYRGSFQNQKPGFGLGLSLVQSIVRTMGGSITVKDNHPKGAVFEIRIKELKLV